MYLIRSCRYILLWVSLSLAVPLGAQETPVTGLTTYGSLVLSNNRDLLSLLEERHDLEKTYARVFEVSDSGISLGGGYTYSPNVPESIHSVTGSASVAVPLLPQISIGAQADTLGNASLSLNFAPLAGISGKLAAELRDAADDFASAAAANISAMQGKAIAEKDLYLLSGLTDIPDSIFKTEITMEQLQYLITEAHATYRDVFVDAGLLSQTHQAMHDAAVQANRDLELNTITEYDYKDTVHSRNVAKINYFDALISVYAQIGTLLQSYSAIEFMEYAP